MSIEAGLIVVLFASVAGELAICVYFTPAVRWAAAFVIPILASLGLYWLPNLSRFHDAEFQTWFLLFFLFWSVPSVIACLLAASIFTFVQRRKQPSSFGRQ